jgi:transcriptional regulator with XRE-family HTH domain
MRESKGLSQRDLAKAVGTSQQQIQRIEAGIQAPRVAIATRICQALGQDMGLVFPSTRKPLAGLKGSSGDTIRDERFVSSMERAGIEMDTSAWTIKAWVRRRSEPLDFAISGADYKRLLAVLQDTSISGFVVFDSENIRVALNRGHLLAWQFVEDPPPEQRMARDEKEPGGLFVYYPEASEPVGFDIDSDSVIAFSDQDEGDLSQLQHLFFTLDIEGADDNIVQFVDTDGDYVFLRTSEVAALTVPLWAIEPKLEANIQREIERNLVIKRDR